MPNPYCQKRKATWYLRLRVPVDLRGAIGNHIIRSLSTGRADEARVLAAAMVARAPAWWAVLRQAAMGMVLGKPIAELTAEDVRRENLPALEADFERLTAEEQKALFEKLDDLLKAAFFDLKAQKRDLRTAEIGLEMMRDAAHRGHAKGLERALEIAGGRATGVGMTPTADTADVPPQAPVVRRVKADPRAAMRLLELAEAENGYFAANPMSEKTRVSYRAAFEQFERCVGIRAVRNITEDDLLEFRAKLEAQKGRDGREKAAIATVQKNLGHVNPRI